MLDFDHQTAKLHNLNLRAEKHGDENVTGADLKIATTIGNDMLAEFHPTLKSLLFRKPHPGEEDLVDQSHDEPAYTRLVFGNKIHVIKWDHEIVGAVLTVHFGTSGKSDIVLDDVTIDGFTLEPLEGGSVVLSFRVKCNPDEKAIGKLSMLIGNEIEISIAAPEADTLREAA